MKGIEICGQCSDYDWKKHKCRRGKSVETNPRNPFYDDCPLPEVVEVVRCKDCKWYMDENKPIHLPCRTTEKTPDWFCADGERK